MRTDILQQAQTIRASMDASAIVLTDEQAAKSPRLYPTMAAGLVVKSGDSLYYSGNDRIYKEIQNSRYRRWHIDGHRSNAVKE